MQTCGGAASAPAGMLKLKQKVGPPPAYDCIRCIRMRRRTRGPVASKSRCESRESATTTRVVVVSAPANELALACANTLPPVAVTCLEGRRPAPCVCTHAHKRSLPHAHWARTLGRLWLLGVSIEGGERERRRAGVGLHAQPQSAGAGVSMQTCGHGGGRGRRVLPLPPPAARRHVSRRRRRRPKTLTCAGALSPAGIRLKLKMNEAPLPCRGAPHTALARRATSTP